MEPYTSSREHLLAELGRIDGLVRAAALRARELTGDDAFRGLSITDEDMLALTERPLGEPHWAAAPHALHAPNDEFEVDTIEERARESREQGIPLRLAILAERFALSRFDRDVLLLALAPELDLKYERLFAYLNDDVTRKRPTVDVALGILCPSLEARLAARHRFTEGAPLRRHEIVRVIADPPDRRSPLLALSLDVDAHIADHLFDGDDIDSRLTPHVRVVSPQLDLARLVLAGDVRARLATLAQTPCSQAAPRHVIYLQGPPGTGKRSIAEALCNALGKRLLIADVTTLIGAQGDARALVRWIAREALLHDAALVWEGFDALLTPNERALRTTVLDALEGISEISFLTGEAPWEPAGALRKRPFARIEIGIPTSADRAQIWSSVLSAEERGVDIHLLANRHRLSGGQIADAAATARGLARLRDPEHRSVTTHDLSAACRLHASRKLAQLAHKLTARASFGDLVLPNDTIDRLREICDHARHAGVVMDQWGFQHKLTTGRGLGVLFSGAPGTGKTMTAGVMAGELGADAYQIDLARVVSKYVGETEKQLAQLFDEAEGTGAILFFDEADALFGKRTEVRDAHDRYANIEISYLLQRMDTYEGVVILATNFSRNMDDAFVRRLRFILEFAPPDEHQRRLLWERVWPEGAPRDPALDLGFMARRFELTGGQIRNVALAAAFLAAAGGGAVTQEHLLHATAREYQKMGKVVDEGTFAYKRR